MRTRIGIALLVMVVLGVFAYGISQPSKGTVEWHKNEYLAAWKRLGGSKWPDLVDRCYARVTGNSLKRSFLIDHSGPLTQDEERLLIHRSALIKLGFLKQHSWSHEPNDQVGPFFYFDHRDSPFVSLTEGPMGRRSVIVFTAPDTTTLTNFFIRWISE
ncbi:MAG TPA: hypothetical protein VK615_04530 [Candidatus Binatia bacterium]|nr:hypothetical protein [Candidatus Binatia bacterium]